VNRQIFQTTSKDYDTLKVRPPPSHPNVTSADGSPQAGSDGLRRLTKNKTTSRGRAQSLIQRLFLFLFFRHCHTHSPPQMPRLTPELIRAARRRHAFLPLLLPECRTIEQASMELRWLAHEGGGRKSWLKVLCERRGRGWPLQYLLGTQPFGALEMMCERGVLIPRFVSC